jgi:hypothetical protein
MPPLRGTCDEGLDRDDRWEGASSALLLVVAALCWVWLWVSPWLSPLLELSSGRRRHIVNRSDDIYDLF